MIVCEYHFLSDESMSKTMLRIFKRRITRISRFELISWIDLLYFVQKKRTKRKKWEFVNMFFVLTKCNYWELFSNDSWNFDSLFWYRLWRLILFHVTNIKKVLRSTFFCNKIQLSLRKIILHNFSFLLKAFMSVWIFFEILFFSFI